MHSKLLAFFFVLLLSSLNAAAQGRTIYGTLLEHGSQMPLPGGSVGLKGTSQGTQTDSNGKFRIQAADGQILVFSYLGYEPKEMAVTSDLEHVHVALQPDTRQLAEVVVTGALGLKRPARELGTASAQIDNQELNQGKVINPLLGLASKVSGLRINMFDSKVDPDVQVNLRGIRSHNGNNAPLYVVDGVPVPDINRLNPNDIQDINILKGANAAAVYGSEGVNGALIITTKKGKAGTQAITFSNTTTIEQVSRLPEQQTEFGNGMNGVYDPLQYQSWGPRFDGVVRPVGGTLPDDSQWELPYSAHPDGRKSFFNTGVTTQNDLSFSGGDNKTTYFFSLQDVLTTGIVPGDKNRRSGARFNGTRGFGKLSTSYNFNFVYNKNDVTPSEPWATAYRLPANIPVGNLNDWQHTGYARPDYFFTTNQANPFFNAANQRTLTEQQTLTGNVQFDYEVAPWFNVIYRLGLYNRSADTRATVGKYTYATPGRTHLPGSVNDMADKFQRLNSDLILNFEQKFGDFSTRLLLGNNLRSDQSSRVNLSASALVVPDLFNQNNRTGELNGSSSKSTYRQVAGYGEFTAGYKNYLFLTFTGRHEAVSVLGQQNRTYFYPGVSSSFIFSDALPALQDSKLLSFGKAYLSYNKTANVVVEPYQLQNVYSQTNGFPFGNLPGFSLGATYYNPDLRPEFVQSYEVGTQLSFFENRVHLGATYAHARTTDGVITADISAGTGYTAALVNAFRMNNDIVEVDLNLDVVRNDNLTWNVGGNFTHIRSEVKEIYGDVERLHTFRQNYLIVGKPYNSYLFTDYRRDPDGRVIVDPNTGNPVGSSELYYGGTGTPPIQLGLHTTLTYRNFTVGAQFDGRLGGVVYTEAANRMIADGTSPLTTQYGRQPFVIPNSSIETAPGVFEANTHVETAGDRTYWANYVAPVQSNYAISADFFKMRELNITYNLPLTLLGNQNFVKQASIGVVGRNVFSIWAKENIYNDPEFVYAGGASEGYLSFRHLPPTRVFGFNVGVTF